MTVDLISLLLFIVLIVLGWRSGALRQLLRILGVVAVFLGAPFISPVLRDLIFDESGTASPGVEVLCLFLAGIAIYLVVSLGAWLMVRILRAASPRLSAMDRLGGASLGAATAALLIYLAVALILLLEDPLESYDPENNLGLRQGTLIGFVSAHNILAPWQFPNLGRLHGALQTGEFIQKNKAFEIVREDPQAAELLRDDRVVDLLADLTLMEWVRADQYPRTLADSRVRDLLNDKEFVQLLRSVDWAVLKARAEERMNLQVSLCGPIFG